MDGRVIARMVFNFSDFSVFMGVSFSLILATISMYLFCFEKLVVKAGTFFLGGGGLRC